MRHKLTTFNSFLIIYMSPADSRRRLRGERIFAPNHVNTQR